MTTKISEIRPLNGNILVRDKKKEEQTSSGIYIPGNAQDDHIVRGTVIATSPIRLEDGTTRQQEDVAEDDLVLYSFTAGAGNAFEEEGFVYRVLRPVEILAKLVE